MAPRQPGQIGYDCLDRVGGLDQQQTARVSQASCEVLHPVGEFGVAQALALVGNDSRLRAEAAALQEAAE